MGFLKPFHARIIQKLCPVHWEIRFVWFCRKHITAAIKNKTGIVNMKLSTFKISSMAPWGFIQLESRTLKVVLKLKIESQI